MKLTRLRWSASGAAHGTLCFNDQSRPCPRAEIDDLAQRLHTQLSAAHWSRDAALEVGQTLWSWLDGDARWLGAITQALTAGTPWRLEVSCELPSLGHLPWETLCDARGVLAERTPWFMPLRRVDDARSALPAAEAPAHGLGVLFMAAAPAGETVLDFEAEEAHILDACRSDGEVLVTVEESGTLRGLERRITELTPRWDVVHLTCHGGATPPVLCLEDDVGALDAVTPVTLSPVIAAAPPQLLALAGCSTGELAPGAVESFASHAVRAGVPAALGFGSRVPDAGATRSMAALYGHLGGAEPLGVALARTRYQALRADPMNDPLSIAAHPSVWAAARLFLTADVQRLAAPTHERAPRTLRHQPDPTAFLRAASGRELKVAPVVRFVGRRRELQRLLRSLAPHPVALSRSSRSLPARSAPPTRPAPLAAAALAFFSHIAPPRRRAPSRPVLRLALRG